MPITFLEQAVWLSVKKIALLAGILLPVLLLLSCASSNNRAPVSSVGQPASHKLNSHTVAAGETLYSIAWRYNLDYQNLAEINGISKPYRIMPGQKLRLSGVAVRLSYAEKKARQNAPKSTPKPVKTPPPAKPKERVIKQTSTPVAVKTQSVKSSPLVWSWPVKGSVISAFQSGKGLNKGIDIGAKLGESVLAAADGEVVYAGSGLRGYGKLIIIKHQNSYLSAYAHNSQLLAKEGDVVKRGQKIAEVGSSGTQSVKLHFEVRHDGVPKDPLQFLPRK